MRLTIHRGSREVGGSCVELAAGSTRLILDAGMPLFDADRNPFDSFAVERLPRTELIARGVIPDVPGLFDLSANPPDAILLSHAHLDHSGLIRHARPSIPVHTTSGTSKMMLAAGVFARGRSLERDRHRAIRPGTPYRVRDFTVTPFAVDHSTFGSVAFLIESTGRSLLYTGDLRLHGRKPGMARELVRAVAPKNIDALLIEGTHFGREGEPRVVEKDVERLATEHAREHRGLVLAAFSPMDVDRLVSMIRAAKRSGRVLVADAYTAFVLYLVSTEARIPKPTAENGIRVFFNSSFRRRRNRKIESLFEADRIELAEVLAQPSRHLMVFRPSMLDLDFGGRLPEDASVIHSSWSGHLAKPEWETIRAAIPEGRFIAAHASGHIHIPDLIGLVKKLDAKRVIPIHTFFPQRFLDEFDNVDLLEDGVPHVIGCDSNFASESDCE